MKDRPLRNFIKGSFAQDIKDCGNIEILGDKRIIIEQVENIIEYENERVRVATKSLDVTVCGNYLSLDSYNDNIIIIDGRIKNISFE